LQFSHPYFTGGVHFFVNALNGTFNFGDEFFMNGNSVGDAQWNRGRAQLLGRLGQPLAVSNVRRRR
jgi:hypothetical protein